MFTKTSIHIANTQPEHCEQIAKLIRVIAGIGENEDSTDYMNADDILCQIKRFPEGQFVALSGARVVGFSITMRTNRSAYGKPLPWIDAIGGNSMTNHMTNGEWLYGVDFAVDPLFRRKGIGSKLYKARFALVKQLNLRGFYAGGMLVGYAKYHKHMSAQAYGEKVMRGEIIDPTVTMQINRGFKPHMVIENYVDDVLQKRSAMLIVWKNPTFSNSLAAIPAL